MSCCLSVFQLPVFREVRYYIVVASTNDSSTCYEAPLASPRGGLGIQVLPIVFKGGEATIARSWLSVPLWERTHVQSQNASPTTYGSGVAVQTWEYLHWRTRSALTNHSSVYFKEGFSKLTNTGHSTSRVWRDSVQHAVRNSTSDCRRHVNPASKHTDAPLRLVTR